MNIISIDVGMRHLAYCVLAKQSSDIFTILDWNVIDLCTDGANKYCMGSLSNNKKCTKRAKYHKDQAYYCKVHAKQGKYRIPTPNLKIKKLKNMRLSQLKELCSERKYIMPNRSKKADYLDRVIVDLSNNYFNFVQRPDSRSIDIVTYGKRIKTCFDPIVTRFDISCTLIENQIGPLALRMKMLQGMIIQHFIEINCSIIKAISPTNKLKEFVSKKKTTYNERKKLGIQITRKVITETIALNSWIQHFEIHKKKDDLADAFLQGLWYIRHC